MRERNPLATTTDAGRPGRQRHALAVGRPQRASAAAGPLSHRADGQFQSKRIPERMPHAKGGGAFAVFQVTADLSAYTRAMVFAPRNRLRCWCGSRRWPPSGVAPTPGETRAGSPRSSTPATELRPGRQQHPVLFIRDPMNFQHFIHSQKRRSTKQRTRRRHAVGLLEALLRCQIGLPGGTGSVVGQMASASSSKLTRSRSWTATSVAIS